MGVCLEERKTCIVTEYMERGSVAKILRVGNMTLETSRVHQMVCSNHFVFKRHEAGFTTLT